MRSSLKLLQRALVGEVGMSAQLEELGDALFNGALPRMWSKLAPATLKNLAGWIAHFERRYAQYKSWVEQGEPAVIWLSGLHIPESYLTALVQVRASHRIALARARTHTHTLFFWYGFICSIRNVVHRFVVRFLSFFPFYSSSEHAGLMCISLEANNEHGRSLQASTRLPIAPQHVSLPLNIF
jgi:hypothetical protein